MENCSCNECISACLNDPGRLVPSDMPKMSRYLKISESDLKKNYLVIVSIKINGLAANALAPAKKSGRRFIAEPGTIAPDYYSKEKGRCIFLDDKERCLVHEVKPFECGAYMGCRDTFLGKPYRARAVEEFFYKRWKSIEKSYFLQTV
jgi:Fe-S-cluster containining protein